MFVSIEALSTQLAPLDVPLEQIYLDPNNPRFVTSTWEAIAEDDIDDGLTKCRWHSNAPAMARSDVRRRIRLRSRPAIIEGIDALNSREFEGLGCAIGELCGASHVHLTLSGNECGIDFFATITVNGNNHVFSGNETPMRIIGQCKKYESRVEVDKVKAFNEAITDVQKKEPKVTALIPAWFQATRGPIIGWMVAHKGFQSGAKTRAHNHGILVSDTIDLAEIAALSRGLSEVGLPNQRCDELVQRARRFLTAIT